MAYVERSELADGVALVTLNRPERLNALSAPLVDELHAALDAIATDESVRVVLRENGIAWALGARGWQQLAVLPALEEIRLTLRRSGARASRRRP